MIAGDAKREIELEPGALRQLVGILRATSGGNGDQDLAILPTLGLKAGIGAAADQPERLGSPFHHCAPVPITISGARVLLAMPGITLVSFCCFSGDRAAFHTAALERLKSQGLA